MEGGSLELVEDMEDLILDTKKRLISANDVNTSNEIKREDVDLCHKNLKELEKISKEFTTVREISKHK